MARRSSKKHKLKKGVVKSYTLTELESEDWGEPPFPSHLVTECHRLRKVPIGDFTTENLRIMIGQNIGLDHLIPMAIQVLRRDPLASGDFFEGDLLRSVIRSEVADQKNLVPELVQLCKDALLRATTRQRQDLSENVLWGEAPSNFGLDDEGLDSLIEDEMAKFVSESPYREFQEYIDRHS